MLMDDGVDPLVLKAADAQTIKKKAVELGMDSMRDDGARKVLRGLTTVEEVLAATQEDVAMEAPPPSLALAIPVAGVEGVEELPQMVLPIAVGGGAFPHDRERGGPHGSSGQHGREGREEGCRRRLAVDRRVEALQISDVGDAEFPDEHLRVIEVPVTAVEARERHELHGEQIVRLGDEDAQPRDADGGEIAGHVEEGVVLIDRGEHADGIVEPVIGQIQLRGDAPYRRHQQALVGSRP